MLKRTNLLLMVVGVFAATALSVSARHIPTHVRHSALRHSSLAAARMTNNDREQDGLTGPVRRVRTETSKLTSKSGKVVEGPRQVLETATYDIKGSKVDTAYFLAAGGSITGKEVYKYDDKGNITEMTLHGDDGTLVSKEVYTYEFDALGNWTKMTTAVAMIEGGKVSFEPTEVTYRVIAYYLDEATIAKMSQPGAPAQAAAQTAAAADAPKNGAVVTAPAAATPTQANAPLSTSNSLYTTPQTANASALKNNGTAAAAVPVSMQPAGAAVTPAGNNSAAANKRVATTPANNNATPPELASVDKGKVLAVSNPSIAGSNMTSGGANAPLVKDDGEAPVARPVMRGPLKPLSGGVLNGKALRMVTPEYPDIARRARAAGTVSVEVVIDVTGKVISARATNGPMMLHQAAEKAAMQTRFTPTLLSGQPVKVTGLINYNFALSQ